MSQPVATGSSRRLAFELIAGLVVLALAAAVRFIAIEADPPGWLSWSAGLFSDEGMYAADALGKVIAGHWPPGNFHGAVVTPPLYAVQLAAFRLFGPTLAVARSASAVFGLATIAFLWIALNAAYGRRAAWTGSLLLAFSAPFVFYNRLALMETPTACCLTAAFACAAIASSKKVWGRADSWVISAGTLFAVAAAFKALAWLALPGFVFGAFRLSRRCGVIFTVAALASFAAYWGIFLLPYAATLRRMNEYYLFHQYLPHSAIGLFHNVKRALLLYRFDGLLPTLALQSPVLLCAAIAGIARAKRGDGAVGDVLIGWLLVSALAWVVMSYAPSRYFVLAMPALAVLAAIGLDGLPVKQLASLVGIGLVLNGAILLAYFAKLNYPTHLAGNAQYHRVVLAGQFAPAITFGTDIVPIYVQPGLANDCNPVEQFEVTDLAVTRSVVGIKWWRDRYPNIINAAHYTNSVRIGNKYDVDMYKVK